MRYAMTITALASGVALLAATQLPAKASPTFDLKSSTSMLQLWVGEAAVVAEAGLTLAAVEWVAAEWATWVIWAAVATTTCGRMARGDMAAQIGTVETLPTTQTLPAITGMGIGIVTTISITGSLSEHRCSMAGITYNGYGNCDLAAAASHHHRQPLLVGALSGLPVLLGSLDEFTLPASTPALAGLRSGQLVLPFSNSSQTSTRQMF